MYADGRGVPQDDTVAVKWYEVAARQGSADAQGNLGFMYQYGRGVLPSNIQAFAWYSVAGASGHGVARENRKKLSEQMTPAQIEIGQQAAKALWISLGN
jgi:hypothetical protein